MTGKIETEGIGQNTADTVPVTCLTHAHALKKVGAFLAGRAEAWLVGGCVRDCILGKTPADIDLVLAGSEQLVRELADHLNAVLVQLSGPFNMYRLVLPGKERSFCLDLELIVDGDILSNLGRRDFSIDAMAIPLRQEGIKINELLDRYGGRLDLERMLIRAVKPSVFEDDSVRGLRAFRLACWLGFEIEPQTLSYIKAMKGGFGDTAGERIWREFRAILAYKKAAAVLQEMEARAGLVSALIPGLALLKRMGQGKWHVLDAWDHTMLALESLEDVLEAKENSNLYKVRELYEAAISGFPQDITPALKLGVLLHDSGKPLVSASGEDGPEFAGHEKAGLSVARKLCERWRLPAWEREIVEAVVGGHMHPLYLYLNKERTLSAKRRFVNKKGRYAPVILVCSLADVMATRAAAGDEDGALAYKEFITEFLEFFVAEGTTWLKLPRFIDGNKVMKILGIGPSPLVGKVLRLLAEKEMSGEIVNEEQAEAYLRTEEFLRCCLVDVTSDRT